MPYLSETACPGVEKYFDIVDAETGEVLPYVKSVDTDLGILEEVMFDGAMANGRPRPKVLYGRPVTRTRVARFYVLDKQTGEIVYDPAR